MKYIFKSHVTFRAAACIQGMEAGIMNNIDFEKIISDLGEALGMTIAFDEDGVCDLLAKSS